MDSEYLRGWLRSRGPRPFAPQLEALDGRLVPAVVATFTPASGTLTVIGDAADNLLAVSRDAAGRLLVNSGAVPVLGGVPTVANCKLVSVFGQGGRDTLTLDDANGPLPTAQVFGGLGDDTLTGGSGGDRLFGQAGNDLLAGRGGADFLFGGTDDDTLTGGAGDDQAFGEAGADKLVWNPGDGSDLNEGGAGSDTIEVNGGNGAEQFTVTANGTRVRFDRLNPAPFALDIGTSEKLVLNANGGDDSFSATGNLAALIQLTVDGGAGNDTLLGSNGADLLVGGDGDDFADGQQGADVALMGAGADVFQWDPGDGSDVVEGQADTDRLLFNGSNAGEQFELAPNGTRVRLTRNIGTVTLDLGGVERADVNAFGGADSLAVRDLAGTGMSAVNLSLQAFGGGGDGSADVVTVDGSAADDAFTVQRQAQAAAVAGLAATVTVSGLEAADGLLVDGGAGTDRLMVFGTAGDEQFDFSANGPRVRLTQAGGVGFDFSAERAELRPQGGADTVVVNDLAGTALTRLELALRAPTGGGDGAADTLVVNGSQAADTLAAGGDSGGLAVSGLHTTLAVFDHDPLDRLTLNGLGGADTLSTRSVRAGVIQLTLNGGLGDDQFLGGDGDELATGGDGDDVASLGAGDDTFAWNPGDDDDTVDGGDGADALVFNGANVAERLDLTANFGRLRLTRDIANIVLDVGGVERVDLSLRGGADSLLLGDLTDTGVAEVNADLGGADGQPDRVVVTGTAAADAVVVTGGPGWASVVGLAARVNLAGVGDGDRLFVNTLGGDDVVDAAGLAAGGIGLTADGGEGDDVLVGGDGDDTLLGDLGDDILWGGPGTDLLDGGPGDDIEIA